MATFLSLGPWAWLIAGLALVALETVVPGLFLVWFGIAAIVTGFLAYTFDPTWQVSALSFAGLALASVAAGRALTRRRDEETGEQPMLNRRGEALVGRIFRLDGALSSGEGRIRVDDTVWRVAGPDLATGSPVRVLRVDGATLLVEPVSS